jgi:surfeit locus 1 family protein
MMKNKLQFCLKSQLYQFKFRLGFFVLCLFFFILFCLLGVWQLHRYHYKKILLAEYAARLTSSPAQFNAVSHNSNLEALQFKKIEVTGRYLNDLNILIQNRMYHEQMGYEVLTPLKVQGEKKLLLIDRGWVKETNEHQPPVIASINSTQKMIGYIKLVNERQFILGQNVLEPNQKPLVIQKINIEELSKLTNQSFFPFILRVTQTEPNSLNSFVRDWEITTVPPERHMGYAIQWFLMAFVLLIAYLCFSCERIENSGNKT